jgi:hypothetical protein
LKSAGEHRHLRPDDGCGSRLLHADGSLGLGRRGGLRGGPGERERNANDEQEQEREEAAHSVSP